MSFMQPLLLGQELYYNWYTLGTLVTPPITFEEPRIWLCMRAFWNFPSRFEGIFPSRYDGMSSVWLMQTHIIPSKLSPANTQPKHCIGWFHFLTQVSCKIHSMVKSSVKHFFSKYIYWCQSLTSVTRRNWSQTIPGPISGSFFPSSTLGRKLHSHQTRCCHWILKKGANEWRIAMITIFRLAASERVFL